MTNFKIRLLLFALVIGAMFPASAHEAPTGWSGYDCRMVSAAWVKSGPNGYELPNGETISYRDKKVKPSPDGEFHWCTKQGKDDTPTICLFAPQPSF